MGVVDGWVGGVVGGCVGELMCACERAYACYMGVRAYTANAYIFQMHYTFQIHVHSNCCFCCGHPDNTSTITYLETFINPVT